ncbi:MAG: hypothetical protein OES47_15450, partial [Acidobacteriota bacterium]|nr:hypothetical protein [Acidobacteriota bacterium]
MRLAAYETGIVLAAAVAPLLPSLGGAVLLLAVSLGWVGTRPPVRETWWVTPLLAAALVLLVLDAADRPASPRQRLGDAADRIEELWSRQDAETDAAVADLLEGGGLTEGDRSSDAARLEAFRRLEARSRRDPEAAMTWLLFEPGGSAYAWAGAGLLHDPVAGEPAVEGRSFRSSFTAVSLLSARTLSSEVGVWRLIVGRGLSKDRLPGEPRSGGASTWSLLTESESTAPGEWLEHALKGARLVAAANMPIEVRDPRRRIVAAALVGAALLVLGLVRLGEAFSRSFSTVGPVVTGVVLAAVACGADLWEILLLSAALGAVVLVAPGSRRGMRRWLTPASGFVIFVLLLGGSYLLQRLTLPVDLGSELIDSPSGSALRLALFLVVLALLLWVPRSSGSEPARQRWAWLTFAAAGFGAAFHAWSLLGPLTLGVATIGSVAWLRSGQATENWTGKAVACLLAAGLAALSWEIAYHATLERDLEERAMEELGPPTLDELGEVEWAARQHFENFDLSNWAATGLDQDNTRDLAFALWQESPLARGGALSAVFVAPDDGASSAFSFGLPLSEDGGLDQQPPVWNELALPGWEEALIGGESDLRIGGEAVGRIRYWSLLRPGFRWAPPSVDRITEGLLQGGPRAELAGGVLPGAGRLALFE